MLMRFMSYLIYQHEQVLDYNNLRYKPAAKTAWVDEFEKKTNYSKL